MQNRPFAIRDCALVAIATGVKAQNLKELRNSLSTIHPGCIYYHFWGKLLRFRLYEPEFNNDFAAWVHAELHDLKLAEQLAVIDPTDYADLEQLRQQLIDAADERLGELEQPTWTSVDRQFDFVRSQIVVFGTDRAIQRPEELSSVVPHLSNGSIFYHFIDARRRTKGHLDDFKTWLSGFGETYAELVEELAGVDPYFVSLTDIRRQLAELFGRYFA